MMPFLYFDAIAPAPPNADPYSDAGPRIDFGELVTMCGGWALMMLGSIPTLFICAVDDYRRKRGKDPIIQPFKER
jgi:hypothetical protein